MSGDTRASLKIQNNAGEAYFFNGSQYARIGGIVPGTTGDKIITGPNDIDSYWPSLKAAGFHSVDAVLPINAEEAYFFSGTRYARIGGIVPGTTGDKIITGPNDIDSYWPSLKAAGFHKVDAVLPVNAEEAYFFSGTQYVRIGGIVPGTTGDKIITGPNNIDSYWPSLKQVGFSTVDNVLPIGPQEAYFFRGTQYARIDQIVPGTTGDHVVNGPSTVASYWPSLKTAGFY